MLDPGWLLARLDESTRSMQGRSSHTSGWLSWEAGRREHRNAGGNGQGQELGKRSTRTGRGRTCHPGPAGAAAPFSALSLVEKRAGLQLHAGGGLSNLSNGAG